MTEKRKPSSRPPTKEETAKANAVRAANKGKRDKVLTEGERAFCLHYIGVALGNGAEAVRLAGFKHEKPDQARRYAYELLRRPRVIAEIERLRSERAARLTVTADQVLADLVRVRDEARLLPRASANLKVQLAAIEKIGEHIGVGAFRKNVGLSSPTGGPIETVDLASLANLSDEELDDLERARAIIDRLAGASPVPDRGDDQSGEGAPEAGA